MQLPSVDELTKTEKKIFFMLAQGKTSREIAEIACNSVRTIQNHRYRIREKLGVKGYNQLTIMAKDYLET